MAERTSRTVGTVHTHLGPQGTVLATVGYTTKREVTVAINASYTFETNATIDGETVTGSGRRLARLSLAGAVPLVDRFRLQGSIFDDLQIPQLGQNQPAAVGLLFAFLAAWT